MKKQAGFTLIELIMVIVILGILSAFALPRFADLSGSAETAAMEGARAAVASSSAISHASALVSGQTAQTGTADLEGATVNLAWGYLESDQLVTAANLSAADFTVGETQVQVDNAPGTDTPSIVIITRAGAVDGDDCFTYQEATDAAVPVVGAMGTWDDADADDVIDLAETCS